MAKYSLCHAKGLSTDEHTRLILVMPTDVDGSYPPLGKRWKKKGRYDAALEHAHTCTVMLKNLITEYMHRAPVEELSQMQKAGVRMFLEQPERIVVVMVDGSTWTDESTPDGPLVTRSITF